MPDITTQSLQETDKLLLNCTKILQCRNTISANVSGIMKEFCNFFDSDKITILIKTSGNNSVLNFSLTKNGTFTNLKNTVLTSTDGSFPLSANTNDITIPLEYNSIKYGTITVSNPTTNIQYAHAPSIMTVAHLILSEVLHHSVKTSYLHIQKQFSDFQGALTVAFRHTGLLSWESILEKGTIKTNNLFISQKLTKTLNCTSNDIGEPFTFLLSHADFKDQVILQKFIEAAKTDRDKSSITFCLNTNKPEESKCILTLNIFAISVNSVASRRLLCMLQNTSEIEKMQNMSSSMQAQSKKLHQQELELAISKVHEKELQLRHDALLDSSKFILWDVDLYAGTIIASETPYIRTLKSKFNIPDDTKDLCEFFKSITVPEDLKFFEQGMNTLRHGKEFNTDIRLNVQSVIKYVRLNFLPIMSETGDWDTAIGTTTDVTEEYIQKENYRHELVSFNTVQDSNRIFQAHVNLSTGRIIRIISADETKYIQINKDSLDTPYDKLLFQIVSNNSFTQNGEKTTDILNREKLIANYNEGKLKSSIIIEDVSKKSLRWVRTDLHLMENPQSKHIELFLYVYDITRQELESRMLHRLTNSIYEFCSIINVTDKKIGYIGNIDYPDLKFFDYDTHIEELLDKYVEDEYKNVIRTTISIPYLISQLNNYGQYSNFFVKGKTGAEKQRNLNQYFYLDKTHNLIFMCATDVTEQYQKEQELLLKTQNALSKVAKANKSKSEFISRISHDIRTPIGAVLNLTQFANEDIDNKEKLKNDLDKIGTSGRLLLSLINDVLDISKIDSGKIELIPSVYPYESYISEIRNILEPLCNDREMHYSIDNEPSPVYAIITDKVRLNQITLNLLSNAVKYTPKGGIITFQTKLEQVSDQSAKLHIVVKDNGIGMSREFQEHMFEEFSQEYNNPLREKATTGTGLGLSIVNKMINLMGGTIRVDSEPGKGSTFYVDIPMETADKTYEIEQQKSTETPDFDIDAFKDMHILLAEDNEVNTEIALRMFSKFGITPEHAENGEIALQMFKDSNPGYYNTIFMDIQMPKMNGYEATEAIRALNRQDAKDIRIIAMTADAFSDAMEKAKKCGMTEYITKPLNIDEIKKILSIMAGNVSKK